MGIKEAVRAAMEKKRKRDKKEAERAGVYRQDAERQLGFFDSTTLPHLRLAAPADYKRWLIGYTGKGGKITRIVRGNFPSTDFYVAIEDFKIVSLFGANSVSIIIPQGIKVETLVRDAFGGLGHHRLYYMRNFMASSCVPVFFDTQ